MGLGKLTEVGEPQGLRLAHRTAERPVREQRGKVQEGPGRGGYRDARVSANVPRVEHLRPVHTQARPDPRALPTTVVSG